MKMLLHPYRSIGASLKNSRLPYGEACNKAVNANTCLKMGEPKVVRVLHLAHIKEDKGLALFPIGGRYNKDLAELRKGDFIQFESGEKFEVVSVALLNLHSAIAEQLCRYIYGHSLKTVTSRWGHNAVLEGFPRDCVSTEQCIQVHYKKH